METAEQLNPIAATEAIAATYLRYLRTTLHTNDANINAAMARAIEELKSPLVKGPIVQASPRYRAGATIRQLVEEGVLSRQWLERDFGDTFGVDRALYAHQEAAVRKAAGQGRNIVVATGTGSGKTESFLIPILEELFRQKERAELGPGVRALLLYPMNALANDQLRRLRELLQHSPDITFGRYTGETPDSRRKGEQALRNWFPDEPILPNELLGREEMQASPPHILLTNYAMLEYLLLRPTDSPLFDPKGELGWRFVVLDEVHTYDGAMGMEMGMLLRRLLDRVQRGPGSIQGIATSATAGGPGDRDAIARFADDLFGLRFEWQAADPGRQDVIVAEVEPPVLPPPGEEVDLEAAADDRSPGALERLLADPRVQAVVTGLAERPLSLDAIARLISDPPRKTLAVRLIERLGSEQHPQTGAPALRARYHTFVRSPESVDVCLRRHADGLPRVFLEPQRHCPECGEDAPVSELAICRRCSQWHLRGQRKTDGENRDRLVRASDLDDTVPAIRYLAPATGPEPNEDNDDEPAPTVEGELLAPPEPEKLLAFCLGCAREVQGKSCDCAQPNVVTAKIAERTKSLAYRCVNCNAPSSQGGLRRLRLGTDAPPAVVASALFDALPRGERRPRFLSFADSRQDAAFFAPYLERTYGRAARRRVMLQALRKAWDDARGLGVRLESLVPYMEPLASELGFPGSNGDALKLSQTLKGWVLAELTAIDSRQSLAGVGLAARRLARPKDWEPPRALLEAPWSLTADEAWWLIQALLRTLLDDQAVTVPSGVSLTDPVFNPRNKPVGFRERGGESRPNLILKGWLPGRDSGTNARVDLLVRVLERTAPGMDPAERRETAVRSLEGLWKYLMKPGGPLAGTIERASLPQVGQYYQLRFDSWEFVPPSDLFRCDLCGAVEHGAVRGVCPSFRCRGTAHPFDGFDDSHHYRRLYQQPPAGPLVAEEHTAQWASSQAGSVQERFVKPDGDINVLSCSTTFELGVDVGELEAVFLRNVPPTAANYVQRAGRVGRRLSSTSLVVTFAQLRPHDRQAFERAEDWVAGNVPAPRIPARNERIVRRHVHSVAMSRFLRKIAGPDGSAWPRVAHEFFEAADGSSKWEGLPCDLLRRYLESREAELQDELKRIAPHELWSDLGIESWEWADRLASDDANKSPLALAEQQYRADVELFRQLEREASDSANYTAARRYQSVLRTFREAWLINLLASRGVLPKYGFPVDVVGLMTSHLHFNEARQLELERDLRIAISEYAPGSAIVAAKQVWRSVGLRVLPHKGLPERQYRRCFSCNRLYASADEVSKKCPQCDKDTSGGRMVEPVYGFVAGQPNSSLGDDPPPRLYASRVLFHEIGGASEAQEPRKPLPALRGRTTVLGRYARNGWLAVVNDARGRGFRFCADCGAAHPGGSKKDESWKHRNPVSPRECSGKVETVHLGHRFASDIAEFEFPHLGVEPRDESLRASVLAALLEGARRALKVRAGDINGLVYTADSRHPVFVIYDEVPGGAGLARESFDRFEEVIREAIRVCECTCGEHSSCYGCLRSYRNQDAHEMLDRTLAREVLTSVLAG